MLAMQNFILYAKLHSLMLAIQNFILHISNVKLHSLYVVKAEFSSTMFSFDDTHCFFLASLTITSLLLTGSTVLIL